MSYAVSLPRFPFWLVLYVVWLTSRTLFPALCQLSDDYMALYLDGHNLTTWFLVCFVKLVVIGVRFIGGGDDRMSNCMYVTLGSQNIG